MEVKVSKCANGHYFDVNKYEICPHCGAGEFSSVAPQKKRFGFLHRSVKPVVTKTTSLQFSREIPEQGQDLLYEDVKTSGTFAPQQLQVEDVQTQGVYTTMSQDTVTNSAYLTEDPDDVEAEDVTTGFFAAQAQTEKSKESKPGDRNTPSDSDGKTTGIFVPSAAPAGSLLEQVQAVADNNDVKTTGFFSLKKPEKEDSEKEAVLPEQLPVGWLVCVSGKNIGRDYRLFAGKNAVGRAEENSVCLAGETSVSRDRHAWVIFEPRKQEFFLKPGDESGLVYLNDENVFDTTLLHSGDVLEFGEVKLTFVALCDSSFNWTNYIDRR